MKKLIRLICIVSCLTMCLCGCSFSKEMSYDKDLLKACLVTEAGITTGSQVESFTSEELVIAEKVESNGIKSWNSISEECGEINSFVGDCEYSVSNGEITLAQEIDCSDRNVLVTATFEEDEENDGIMTMTSISYEQVYSTAEKLQQAGMNTALGMGTVFAVLIFIYLIISCFAIIPKITEAMEKKKGQKETKANVASEETVNNETVVNTATAVNDDSELIAVIAAAIAASENTTTDSFVVRSIRKR